MDDQVLDLALMTNYSQSNCCQLVVSICIDPILSGFGSSNTRYKGKLHVSTSFCKKEKGMKEENKSMSYFFLDSSLQCLQSLNKD